jgi:phage terminase Nu1 subunit (DNA packaging protein)
MVDPFRGDEFVVNTLTAVARFFSVARPTVTEWRNSGMPVRDDGRYDLSMIFHWWKDSEKGTRTKGTSSKPPASLETQKLEIEIAHKRLKLQMDAGELVNRELAYSTIESMFHRVRTRLEAIPEELSSSLPPDIRATYIEDSKQKIRLVLREMENWAIDSG